jgi:hypothetical protein
MKLSNLKLVAVAFAAVTLSASQNVFAQKSGQSMQIQYGVVVASSYVQEKSDAGKAALVGGAVGYGLTRNRSTSTKVAGTAIGRKAAVRHASTRSGRPAAWS